MSVITIRPASPSLDDYRVAIDAHVNDVARAQDYNDAATLAGYVNSTVPQWASDAATFVGWRDQVWVYAFAELAKVQAAQREQPSVPSFLAELPDINW